MPNHIINRVSSKKLEEIAKAVKSEHSAFDFNKIIPMPKELEGTSSPARIVSQKEYDLEMADKTPKDPKRYYTKPITKAMSEDFLRRFGANEWYEWSIKNWGTKWNAYEVQIEGDCIEFQTAWATPVPIIAQLSRMFSDVDIKVEYADEDIGGGNCGIYTLKNGEVILDEQGDEKFAAEMHGYDYDEFLKERDA